MKIAASVGKEKDMNEMNSFELAALLKLILGIISILLNLAIIITVLYDKKK